MKNTLFYIFSVLVLISCSEKQKIASPRVTITLSENIAAEAFDGRMLLMLSNNKDTEPRFQINDGGNTQLIFGKNVEGLKPGASVTFTNEDFGFPFDSLSKVPKGSYYVQALLHTYETFNLSTGHTVKLPMDNGEGQQWNTSPGNMYNEPFKVSFDASSVSEIQLTIDKIIPPIAEPKDTEWVKHIKMKSESLSKFYGRDMYLGAHILVPKDFDKHPEAKYPLMVFQGHFPSDFGDWRTEPLDPNMKSEYSDRFKVEGYNKIVQQEAYDFYTRWNAPDFPRMLIIEIQHPTPYYDDSYAVNSAAQGPYGDAITYELIPYIEEQFRGIGEGWARFLYGGSTGGWEALAVQVNYPDEYNGCFAACPDPIDFRAYCLTNIYEDDNAYYYKSDFNPVEVPSKRNYLGHITTTLKRANHLELVLGDKSRSGQQWDIWEATYSPLGKDGYPQRIWDKYTGDINKEVANHWKENYDLRYILERDWSVLGEKLKGKIHIYCGDMDNYYLNNAVYLMEDFLENTSEPYYDGEVEYGDRAEHCWNGDPTQPNHITRLRYNSRYLPKIMKRIEETAPKGADLTSWRYE